MKDIAFTVNLTNKPEIIDQYKTYHSQVWPEVLSALKKVGVIDMKIYLLGRSLFMYCQVHDEFDHTVDFPKYLKEHPRCQQWEDLMGSFQEAVTDAKEGEKWALMEKVFSF